MAITFHKLVVCISFLLIPVFCKNFAVRQTSDEDFQNFVDTLSMTFFPSNPYPVTTCPLLTQFCDETINAPANYPNPYNCNTYIDCGSDQPYIWSCTSDCYYDPFADLCAYAKYSGCNTTWSGVWDGDSSCGYVGQRPWTPMALPADPATFCGNQYYLCGNFTEETGILSCPNEFAYSKALEGCFPSGYCSEIDQYFDLTVKEMRNV